MYQMVNGARREISGGYRLVDAHNLAFAVGSYDPGLPLVIDPILSYSTYFGGEYGDTAWSVKVDTNGFVYVAGETLSTQFPTEYHQALIRQISRWHLERRRVCGQV